MAGTLWYSNSRIDTDRQTDRQGRTERQTRGETVTLWNRTGDCFYGNGVHLTSAALNVFQSEIGEIGRAS